MARTTTNLAASIHQRLLNKARAMNRPFADILQRYAIERFIYRLSRSPHADRFILKGGLMLQVWGGGDTRATKDIDFLGKTSSDPDSLVAIVREVCGTPVEPDGMDYDAKTIMAQRITEDAEYQGIRVVFTGQLGKAKIRMQVDVGFGDVIVPAAGRVTLPTLLDLPAPELNGYSMESSIAEKFQAMVMLGAINSRMKDFYDIWMLSQTYDFDGARLAKAISTTFRNRDTDITVAPAVFDPSFATTEKQRQWQAFKSKSDLRGTPGPFEDVLLAIRSFLGPVMLALTAGEQFRKRWLAAGPWT